MRKLFLALFVLCSFFASAQKIQKVNTYGYEYNRFISDTLFALPGDTFAVPAAYQSYPFLARKATTLYLWNTVTFIWEALAGGVTSVYRKTATDSVFQVINNVPVYAFKDSSGGAVVDTFSISTRAWNKKGNDSLGAVINARTLQQVLTAGSTLTTDNTIDFGGNNFILKGDSVVIKDPSGNERIRLIPNGTPSEGDATKIKLTNVDGATMIIQTGDEYLETLTGWVIRNTIGYNPVLSVNGASTGQTSPLIEVIQNSNDSIFTIISSGNVGIGDRTPDTSSLLDVSSTSKGVLIPRMTTTQRNAISLPAIGLMIYNTTDSAFNFYRAGGWSAIGGGGSSVTASNGLTKTGDDIKLGGTLSENTTIGVDDGLIFTIDNSPAGQFMITDDGADTVMLVASDALSFPLVRAVSNTTGKKIMLQDTATGLVQNIDPALLGFGATNTLATFGAGAGLSTDTAAFQTTSIYGSFYNDGTDTLIITKAIGVLQGSSPSITPTIYFNDSLNVTAGATKLVNSPSALTNTTTGTAVTSFDNYKIPPGNWVWVKTSTLTTKPTYFSLSLIGYKKPVI